MRTVLRAPERMAVPELSSPAIVLPVRVVGAAALLATGGLHLYLWQTGYRTVPIIGPLFLVNAALAALAALAVLASPRRWLPWMCLLAGLLEIGTLGGLLLSLTVGLFGFVETWAAPLVVPTIVAESVGFVVLCGFAAHELLAARRAGTWRGR